MPKIPHPTIQSFFSPIPSKSTSAKRKHLHDGFDDIPPPAPPSPWTPKSGIDYTAAKIGAIKPGPGRITFTGRVANFREQERNPRAATAAKVLLRMALMDDTGVIDIKFWLTRPSPAATTLLKLGALATVHTTFVAALSLTEKESSAAQCMVSVSDTDSSAHVEFHEDADENWGDYRIPMGITGDAPLEGLMPLKVFVESGTDVPCARLLVCVKWKGAKKQVQRKDGGTAEKRDIGVFDDTMEATLTLWGSTTASANTWDISKTILLLTSPTIKLWRKDVQVTLGHSTLVEVDPIHRDSQWLRNYAKKLLRKPDICQPFPATEFDWEEGLYGERRIKYTFADIDKYSRNVETYVDHLPTGQCVGWLNVVIVEMNVATSYRRNMLLCGSCCGFTVFTNSFSATCKKCEEPIAVMLPNPNIIGRVSDETGCISGGHLIWSERAWESLLGRSVRELAEETSKEALQYFDDYFLFTRISLAFGWDAEIGKIAIYDVLAS